MATDFCQRCYDKYWLSMREKHPDISAACMSKEDMSFPCKIPIFEHNSMGAAVVKVWDCEKEVSTIYTQEEWLRKRKLGEF